MADTLNGPAGGMYSLAPYYKTSENMETPDCMYKLQRIYGNNQNEAAVEENLPPEVKQLEQRQEGILARLEALRKDVDKLSVSSSSPSYSYKLSSLPSASSTTAAGTTTTQRNLTAFGGQLRDLVVSASPANPPLSLLVLADQLADQYRLLASSHVHSSASTDTSRLFAYIAPQLRRAFSTRSAVSNRAEYQLVLTVIWKQGLPDTTLMVTPNLQTAVQGEANIARYLSRLLNPAYDGYDIITATEIDGWLDLSASVLHGNNKERAAGLRTLNARLGKNSWIVGTGPTLADIVMWSALQQNKMTSAVPSNVKKWLEQCNKLAGFQRALDVMSSL